MEYKVYRTRWLLLLIESLTSFTRTYIAEAFAILNNEIAHFFDVNPYEIDVLATVDTLVAVPLCLLIALIGKNQLILVVKNVFHPCYIRRPVLGFSDYTSNE